MAAPNVVITVAQKFLLHSNPEDRGNDPIDPATLPSAVAWSTSNNSLVTLAPQGVNTVDCEVSALAVGTAIVFFQEGSNQGAYTVEITAGPFDHFAPANDAPANQ
jgi:hypothetical protein